MANLLEVHHLGLAPNATLAFYQSCPPEQRTLFRLVLRINLYEHLSRFERLTLERKLVKMAEAVWDQVTAFLETGQSIVTTSEEMLMAALEMSRMGHYTTFNELTIILLEILSPAWESFLRSCSIDWASEKELVGKRLDEAISSNCEDPADIPLFTCLFDATERDMSLPPGTEIGGAIKLMAWLHSSESLSVLVEALIIDLDPIAVRSLFDIISSPYKGRGREFKQMFKFWEQLYANDLTFISETTSDAEEITSLLVRETSLVYNVFIEFALWSMRSWFERYFRHAVQKIYNVKTDDALWNKQYHKKMSTELLDIFLTYVSEVPNCVKMVTAMFVHTTTTKFPTINPMDLVSRISLRLLFEVLIHVISNPGRTFSHFISQSPLGIESASMVVSYLRSQITLQEGSSREEVSESVGEDVFFLEAEMVALTDAAAVYFSMVANVVQDFPPVPAHPNALALFSVHLLAVYPTLKQQARISAQALPEGLLAFHYANSEKDGSSSPVSPRLRRRPGKKKKGRRHSSNAPKADQISPHARSPSQPPPSGASPRTPPPLPPPPSPLESMPLPTRLEELNTPPPPPSTPSPPLPPYRARSFQEKLSGSRRGKRLSDRALSKSRSQQFSGERRRSEDGVITSESDPLMVAISNAKARALGNARSLSYSEKENPSATDDASSDPPAGPPPPAPRLGAGPKVNNLSSIFDLPPDRTQLKRAKATNSAVRPTERNLGSLPKSDTITVLLIGYSGVGRTSIARVLSGSPFDSHQATDSEKDISKVQFSLFHRRVEIIIPDLSFFSYSLLASQFAPIHGIVMVYDSTDIDSYKDLFPWFKNAEEAGTGAEAVVVGNRCDEERVVPLSAVSPLAEKFGLQVEEVSAATGDNLQVMFNGLMRRIIPRLRNTRKGPRANLSGTVRLRRLASHSVLSASSFAAVLEGVPAPDAKQGARTPAGTRKRMVKRSHVLFRAESRVDMSLIVPKAAVKTPLPDFTSPRMKFAPYNARAAGLASLARPAADSRHSPSTSVLNALLSAGDPVKPKKGERRKSAPRRTKVATKAVANGRKILDDNVPKLEEVKKKLDRSLSQCSIHADVPRLVGKMNILREGVLVWPLTPAKSSVEDITAMFEVLERLLKHLPTASSFSRYFVNEMEGSDIQHGVQFYVQTILGETDTLTHLLKANCSQGIVAPVWVWIKLSLLAGIPFKDKPKGWMIFTNFREDGSVEVIHKKTEQERRNDDSKDVLPRFYFTWEMYLKFSPVRTIGESGNDQPGLELSEFDYGISSLVVEKDCPHDLGKLLKGQVKKIKVPSFTER